MKKLLLITLGSLLMAYLFFLPAHASAQETGAFKIGFVNFRKVFDKYERTDEVNNKIRSRQKELQAEIDELQNKGKRINDELTLLNQSSDEYAKKEQELAGIGAGLKRVAENGQKELETFLLTNFESIYLEIHEAVEAYGKDHGYTLILKIDDMDEASIRSKSRFELNEKIHHRPVLFFKKELDVTNDIIDAINENDSATEK